MSIGLKKDESILRLIERLKSQLGEEAFDVVDYWDSDFFAVGIAKPDNHGILVYVCTFRQSAESYFVSLELPPGQGNEVPFTSLDEFEVREFGELVETIRRHFSNV